MGRFVNRPYGCGTEGVSAWERGTWRRARTDDSENQQAKLADERACPPVWVLGACHVIGCANRAFWMCYRDECVDLCNTTHRVIPGFGERRATNLGGRTFMSVGVMCELKTTTCPLSPIVNYVLADVPRLSFKSLLYQQTMMPDNAPISGFPPARE